MDPATVARDVEAIVDGLDSPLGDPTAIPTWYMSRLAREQVTVALSGEGADEIFGGYARQRYDVALDRIGRFGRRLLPFALRTTGRKPSERLLKRLAMEPGLHRQLDWGRVFTDEELDGLMFLPPGSDDSGPAAYDDLARRWLDLAAGDPVNSRLMADREVFLPADLLPKVDRMSMAHSLEVRVPYLDNDVVDLMLTVPGALKQSLRRDKILLREASSSLLPTTAATRKKRGFEVPIGAWLRGSLRPVLLDWLSPDTIRKQGLLRPQVVSRIVDTHLRGDLDLGKQLWTLMVLSRWMETSGHSMKIALLSHLASERAPTGAEHSLALLASGLRRRGHDVVVTAPGPWSLAAELKADGVDVESIPVRACWLVQYRRAAVVAPGRARGALRASGLWDAGPPPLAGATTTRRGPRQLPAASSRCGGGAVFGAAGGLACAGDPAAGASPAVVCRSAAAGRDADCGGERGGGGVDPGGGVGQSRGGGPQRCRGAGDHGGTELLRARPSSFLETPVWWGCSASWWSTRVRSILFGPRTGRGLKIRACGF